MKRFLLIAFLAFTVALGGSAQYVLRDFGGDVRIERAGKSSPVTKEMKLSGSDILDIPEGGFVELLNTASSQLFRSTTHGRFATTRIMIDARSQASDKGAAISDNVTIGVGRKKKQKVYEETGMITRSIAHADSDNSWDLPLDPAGLAATVAHTLVSADFTAPEGLPVSLTTDSLRHGVRFSTVNHGRHQVYFNVLSYNPAIRKVRISELGQEGANFSLPSLQILARGQMSTLDREWRHFIVLTFRDYDVHALVNDVNALLAGTGTHSATSEAPVYIPSL